MKTGLLAAGCLLAFRTPGLAQTPFAPSAPVLATARQVHELSVEQARRGYPVALRATVTYSDLTGMLFVADASGGMFVVAPCPHKTWPFGMRVTVLGVTGPGDFAPVVHASRIIPAGLGTLPPAPVVSFEDLASGSQDCEWVEFRGIVRAAGINPQTGFAELRVAAGGGQLRVQVAGTEGAASPNMIGASLERLVDTKVHVRGAVGGTFNQRRQLVAPKLFVPSPDQVVVAEPAPTAPFEVPTRAVESLLQYMTSSSYGHRVKLAGTVTLSQPPHTVFIRDATDGLEIQPQATPALQVGDQIEAIGFPVAGQWTPMLQDAVIRKVGSGAARVPVAVTVNEALQGNFDSELIQLDAKLLDYVPRQEAEWLVLESAGLLFNAVLAGGERRDLLAGLPKGANLRLMGICQVQVVGPERRRESFRMLLRDGADLRILQRPSWWTLARILWALTVMTAVLLLALGWVCVLKRRVRAQTQLIRQQLQQEAILEERARIAREFHDTLEQELIGITMQVDAARARIKAAPDVALEGLHLAARMIRRTIGEARRSVLALRSRALEQGDLGSALVEVAQPVLAGTSIDLHLEQSGRARRLPGVVEDNLLRIGQEAITNTLKHAGASSITLLLDYRPNQVSLRVRDNGSGFPQPANAQAASGHFGLLGMRERAARIHARLAVSSALAAGTEILVEVPLDEQPTMNHESRTLQNQLR